MEMRREFGKIIYACGIDDYIVIQAKGSFSELCRIHGSHRTLLALLRKDISKLTDKEPITLGGWTELGKPGDIVVCEGYLLLQLPDYTKYVEFKALEWRKASYQEIKKVIAFSRAKK